MYRRVFDKRSTVQFRPVSARGGAIPLRIMIDGVRITRSRGSSTVSSISRPRSCSAIARSIVLFSTSGRRYVD